MAEYRLADLLDLHTIQKMADAHYRTAGMPIGIIDEVDGSILVGAGWQDICLHFHRANPVSLQRCRESDDYIKTRSQEGETCAYKCRNGLWDIGIPIRVAGRHLATLFLGQFLYEGEIPDRDFFRKLAQEYGFPLDEYLAALDRVPVFPRERVNHILEYNKALAEFLADLAARSLETIESNRVLRENERKFHAIFDQAYQFLGLLSVDGKILEANRTALNFSAIEEADVVGKPFWETPWWKHDPAMQEKLRQAITRAAAGDWVHFEATHRDARGNLAYIDFSLSPITDEHGKVVLLKPEGWDITELKRAEQEIMRQAEFLQQLIDAMPYPVFYKDRQGRYLSCNRAFEQFYGVSRQAIAGKTAYDVAPEELARKSIQADEELFADPGTRTYEGTIRAADGTVHDVLIQKAPFAGSDGAVAGIVGAVVDITARKQVERSLRENQTRLRTLLQTIPDLVWLKNVDGVYLGCNTTFGRFFGATEAEIVGKTDYDFVDQELADSFREHDRTAIASGHPSRNEEWITFADDGHRALLETIKTPMFRDDGTLVGVLGIARDITERKRSEEEKIKLEAQLQQAQKMESVGRLAGGVAHDFNNMLSVILGHTELAMTEVDPSHSLYASLVEINKAAYRSADLTRQLLAFARKQIVEPKVLDLNQAVSGMLNMLRRLIGEDIGLAWKPAEDLWLVKADPSQIDQILANLCVNARDAIKDVGKITIETSNVIIDGAFCVDHAGFIPGEYVKLAVTDNGCGIAEDALPHLFEPFFTTKGLGEGTGLGLAMVYGAVQQNEGMVHVFSEPGRGATFEIYLPHFAAGENTSAPATAPDMTPGGNETILLVEDDTSILEMGKRMLETLGYHPLAANTAREAREIVTHYDGEIHLLMTDVVMPEMNGRDLASELKRLRPMLKTLFVSGYTANIIAHHGLEEEGGKFLQKPFSKKELARKIREALSAG